MSYGTVIAFRAYHAARNRTLPATALDDDAVTAALLVASEWIDGRYRGRFSGYKTLGREQVREWPRVSATDIYQNAITGVPIEVENATYEAAAIEMATPGGLIADYTPGKYKSVNVAGAVAVTYATFFSLDDVQTHFALVEQVLMPVLAGSAPVSFVGQSVRG